MARGKQRKTATKKRVPKRAAKPEAPRDDDGDEEPSDTELMLQTLACPSSTADRLSEVCEGAVARIKEDLTGIAAAELVWRKRPERDAIATAVTSLASELERHAEVMLGLYDQFRAIAEDESDHTDLELPDVLERLQPLINSLAPEE